MNTTREFLPIAQYRTQSDLAASDLPPHSERRERLHFGLKAGANKMGSRRSPLSVLEAVN